MPSLLTLSLLPLIGLALFYSSPFLQELIASYGPPWTSSSSLAGPAIRIPQGLVVGTVLDHGFPEPIEAFLGLPYAQPPTGDKRFRPAVPLPQSNGTVFEAKKYGNVCPGKQLLKGNVNPSSEDCMTVNIFRQKPVQGVKVPVAVYIHGGAFNRGSSMLHNTGSMVAWSEKPFVGVSFNYRIGALGFLPSKLTFDEGIVNLGLHDQVFLLQWVKDNIASFGGNPDDVTIFGLSAGAHSIGHHILNYKEGVEPLFHQAILESGAPTSRAVHPYNAPVHEEQFALFLSQAGCSNVPDEQKISCLRAQKEEIIVKAQAHVFYKYNPSLRWAFQPVIDHELIHSRPIDAWRSGKWNKVPIMTGHTTNEGTYYVPPGLSTTEEFTDFWHTLLPHYSKKDLATINELYPDPEKYKTSVYKETRNMTELAIGPQYKRVEAAYAHYAYVCPVRQTASITSAVQNHPPIYVYHWALNQTVKGGANHGDNMWYETFDSAITSISEAQKEVSGLYHAYITSFITQGNPNVNKGRYGHRPTWQRYVNGEKEVAMNFGKGNDERAGGTGIGVAAQLIGSEWVKKECGFWWEKSADTEE